MKKFTTFVLALACALALAGCVAKQQSISEEDKNQLIYGETQVPSDDDIIQGAGGALDPVS